MKRCLQWLKTKDIVISSSHLITCKDLIAVQLKLNHSMKEMLGGCCVCSDERGWTENPLVYCDGQGCTVAVHQGNNSYIDTVYSLFVNYILFHNFTSNIPLLPPFKMTFYFVILNELKKNQFIITIYSFSL